MFNTSVLYSKSLLKLAATENVTIEKHVKVRHLLDKVLCGLNIVMWIRIM